MEDGIASFPMKSDQAAAVQNAAAQRHGVSRKFVLDLGGADGGVTLEMILVPAGEFVMGSPDDEDERYETEGPQHRVRFSYPFYMGQYAVTQAQWAAVLGTRPAFFQGDLQLPIENVSWDECLQFCEGLSAQLGREVRLPSEAEWEYACRAGSPTRYCFGDSEDDLERYAWYGDNVAERYIDGLVHDEWEGGHKDEFGHDVWDTEIVGHRSHPVGEKLPNAWGLYDMHGGIDEYCQDTVHASYNGAPDDGRAWMEESAEEGTYVLRGGSWYDIARHCRSAHRNAYRHDKPSEDHGFRIVLPLK